MKSVILVNVGTPESPEPQEVGAYLNEFLMDKNIISIPRPFRDFLVKVIIVPRRKFTSSEKYKKIWTPSGSPLMLESEKMKKKLQTELGEGWNVVLGMQVGKPNLRQVFLNAMSKYREIYFCPLYPQYAPATTGVALEATQSAKVKILNPFYSESWFIKSVARQIKKSLKAEDCLLLSYHGLPISQLKKKNSFCYKTKNCCLQQLACEANCYKAHCLQTTELLRMELGHENMSIGFQSRLGGVKWTQPSTDQVMRDLVSNGVKNLKIACPSFVADCLETLEEIGIELKSEFLRLGGKTFELIPCVNDQDDFVKGLADKLKSL